MSQLAVPHGLDKRLKGARDFERARDRTGGFDIDNEIIAIRNFHLSQKPARRGLGSGAKPQVPKIGGPKLSWTSV
jgi:hypothetical protein